MHERDLIEYKKAQERAKIPDEFIPPRIAGLDPGRQRDSFAMAGLEIRPNTFGIMSMYIIGAAQWLHKDYEDVEAEVAVIHKTTVRRPFNYIAVETNNSGLHVVSQLRRVHHLPILPINTVGKVTDPKKILEGNSMAKNDMVQWLQRVIQNTVNHKPTTPHLYFPDAANSSPGVEKLRNQLPKFTRKLTDAGNLSYSAQGREHDDLVMALLLAAYVARTKYLRGSGEVMAGSKTFKPKTKISKPGDYFPELQADGFVTIKGISASQI